MKSIQYFAFLSFISLVIFASCSKKSDDVNPDPAANAGFSVKIDGKTYAPDFSYALDKFPGNDLYYAIYGLDSKTNDVVAIALPKTVGEGTFPINDKNFVVMTLNQEQFSTINGGEGTITIKKKTATNIVGTFSLTAVDAVSGQTKRVLTDGAFNVNVR